MAIGNLHSGDHDSGGGRQFGSRCLKTSLLVGQRQATRGLEYTRDASRPVRRPRTVAGVVGPLHDDQGNDDLVNAAPEYGEQGPAPTRIAGKESCRSTMRITMLSTRPAHDRRPARRSEAPMMAAISTEEAPTVSEMRNAVEHRGKHVAALIVSTENCQHAGIEPLAGRQHVVHDRQRAQIIRVLRVPSIGAEKAAKTSIHEDREPEGRRLALEEVCGYGDRNRLSPRSLASIGPRRRRGRPGGSPPGGGLMVRSGFSVPDASERVLACIVHGHSLPDQPLDSVQGTRGIDRGIEQIDDEIDDHGRPPPSA